MYMSIYGLLIGISAVIYVLYIDKTVLAQTKYAINHSNTYYIYFFLPLILGLIFARLIPIFEEIIKYFSTGVLTNAISDNNVIERLIPNEIFSVQMQGLSYFGAIIGGILGILIISRILNISKSTIIDHTFYILPALQSIGRIGNFINKELYGLPTDLLWGIYIPIEKRIPEYINFDYYHPTFAYEIILNIFFFITITLINKRLNLFKKPFLITALYLIFYGAIRLIINRIRIIVESSDIFSIFAIIIGLSILIIINLKKSSKSNII